MICNSMNRREETQLSSNVVIPTVSVRVHASKTSELNGNKCTQGFFIIIVAPCIYVS